MAASGAGGNRYPVFSVISLTVEPKARPFSFFPPARQGYFRRQNVAPNLLRSGPEVCALNKTLKQFVVGLVLLSMTTATSVRADGTASAADFAESVGHLFDKLPEKFRLLVEEPKDPTNWYVALGPLAGILLSKAWAFSNGRSTEFRRMEVLQPFNPDFVASVSKTEDPLERICELAVAHIGYPKWKGRLMWGAFVLAAGATSYSAQQTLSQTGKLPWQIANERVQEKANQHIAGIADKRIEEVAPKMVEKAVDEQARPFFEQEAPKIIAQTFKGEGERLVTDTIKKAEEDKTPLAIKAWRDVERYPTEHAKLERYLQQLASVLQSRPSRLLLARHLRRNVPGYASYETDTALMNALETKLPLLYGDAQALERELKEVMERYAERFDLLKPDRELVGLVYTELVKKILADGKIAGEPDRSYYDYIIDLAFKSGGLKP